MSRTEQYRALILEDEPVIGRILDRLLRHKGFSVDIATDGLDAKEKIEADTNYDVLIFDIRTPVISGIQLFEHLKENYPELAERVIFATGDYYDKATETFLESAKRPYIYKPYTPEQIKGLIFQIIAKNPALI
jgi:CheY-like chemotaxis protein